MSGLQLLTPHRRTQSYSVPALGLTPSTRKRGEQWPARPPLRSACQDTCCLSLLMESPPPIKKLSAPLLIHFRHRASPVHPRKDPVTVPTPPGPEPPLVLGSCGSLSDLRCHAQNLLCSSLILAGKGEVHFSSWWVLTAGRRDCMFWLESAMVAR